MADPANNGLVRDATQFWWLLYRGWLQQQHAVFNNNTGGEHTWCMILLWGVEKTFLPRYDAWYSCEVWRKLFCHVMMHDMIVRCGEDFSATLWWMIWLWGVEKTFLPHYNAWYDYEMWRKLFCHIIMHDMIMRCGEYFSSTL